MAQHSHTWDPPWVGVPVGSLLGTAGVANRAMCGWFWCWHMRWLCTHTWKFWWAGRCGVWTTWRTAWWSRSWTTVNYAQKFKKTTKSTRYRERHEVSHEKFGILRLHSFGTERFVPKQQQRQHQQRNSLKRNSLVQYRCKQNIPIMRFHPNAIDVVLAKHGYSNGTAWLRIVFLSRKSMSILFLFKTKSPLP